jgi:ribosome modulation factor
VVRIELLHEAYRAGYAAGLVNDKPVCPYSPKTQESFSWLSGLIEGVAKRGQGYRPPRLVDPPRK